MSEKVRVGVIGTSWWADAMYLPALTRHPLADVRAVVGARPEHTREFAARWGIPGAFDSLDDLFAAEPLDAVLVLTPNREHFPTTMAALDHGLHVLCEKPLGMDSAQARQMTDAAADAGLVTMTPFTYRFMPSTRWVKELIDEGYLGRAYHLDMRYFSGYGRGGEYQWRFDLERSGGGTGADLGAHWVYLARWFFGEIVAVTSVFGHSVPRAPRPDGGGYDRAEDSAVLVLEFENGATGSLHVTSVAYTPSPFGQHHAFDLHGSGGTLRLVNDWDRVERVEGARDGEPTIHELAIPDRLFGTARRDTVQHTYQDTFREHDHMARAFISAIADGSSVAPDFRDGLAVQRVVDGARLSALEGRRVAIAEIVAGEAARGA